MALEPAVQNQLDSGKFGIIPLVYLQIPNNNVGYYNGPRNLVYNSITYKPNQFLEASKLVENLGIEDGERTLTFSGMQASGSEIIDIIQTLQWRNAPVTVTELVIDIETDEIKGPRDVQFYEIAHLSYNEDDSENLNEKILTVTLKKPGHVWRDRANTFRTNQEQQFDNNSADTFFKRSSIASVVERKWGQYSG